MQPTPLRIWPYPNLSKEEMIDFCASVLDKTTKRYPVVPSIKNLCSNGEFYSVFGIPSGVTVVEPGMEQVTYVYQDLHSNTTFAPKPYHSKKEAESEQETRIKRNIDTFRSDLDGMPDDELKRQFRYWYGEAKAKNLQFKLDNP